MFTDCMLETSWGQRSRRSVTTLTSFAFQAAVMGLFLLLPLWKTVGLPAPRIVSTPIFGGRRAPEPAGTPHTGRTTADTPSPNPARPMFVAPGRIPKTISTRGDDPAPPSGDDGIRIAGSGSLPGGEGDPFPMSIITGPGPALPTVAPREAPIFKTSNMLEGSLIHRVIPTYPPLAKAGRIQGAVVLFAVISKAGTIDNLHAVLGHPMLVPAAVAAVSQWRYRPYILNSEPVEVETQITVNFVLEN